MHTMHIDCAVNDTNKITRNRNNSKDRLYS